MGKLSVFLLLMVLVNISWAEISSDSLATNSPSEELNTEAVVTENVDEVETTTGYDDGESLTTETLTDHSTAEQATTEQVATEQVATEQAATEQAATEQPTSEQVTTEQAATEQKTTTESESTDFDTEANTTELNEDVDTTTNLATESQTTTVAPAPVCNISGVQAHKTDCQQYYECSSEGSQDESLHLITKSCPVKQAFSTKLNRCSRDISSCSLDIQCTSKGSIADSASNTSYYYCVPYYDEIGFHIFHINCASYEEYYPALGRCFINLQLPLIPPLVGNEVKDFDIVKLELKAIKNEYKLKLQEKKKQQKAEEKLQKEKEKEAKKQAKKEEKLKKEAVKLEAANFVCAVEGNFASKFADNQYIVCIKKKDKIKALSMQCAAGTSFDSATGSCVGGSTAIDNSLDSDEENED